ncbi:MarR family winged helix-turn-helix transcriptional regulator [Paenibacillus sacheonensis]|uniref:MarR family transcriptional regulator n=1 Tax=Paenibacillus sacheonensis TaxID=742054 RepID=A0A7X4YL10_9BACL|nr:MarR family transcriptional regulator [Paenibacillus sacheonensis]MBM7563099.1 DNA-binding MarR family transcriptional regulator [Paenibacillus sacheonensis]NBC68333.1 MarR family transcriptional regulator [Paenibacillus sacheonensis]
MDNKELFHQAVSFITAVHQVTFDMTKDFELGDITPVQYGMLEYIAVSQPVTLSEISECKHISMPNTSRELKKLTDRGLCEKFDAPEDKRKQYIRLSAVGQSFMNAAFAHMEKEFQYRLRHSTEADLKRIAEAMQVLQESLFQEGFKSGGA